MKSHKEIAEKVRDIIFNGVPPFKSYITGRGSIVSAEAEVEAILKLVEEAKEDWCGTKEEQKEEKELDEAVEAHKKELGYCCACLYDVTCMEERVTEAKREERDKDEEVFQELCHESSATRCRNDICWHNEALKALRKRDDV